jgi:hypothetical protein
MTGLFRIGIVLFAREAEDARRRNRRSDDNISAYYAERFRRAWIMSACLSIAQKGETPRTAS